MKFISKKISLDFIKNKNFFAFLTFICVVVLLDQVTKNIAKNYFMSSGESMVSILPFLHFTFVFNYGISFGFLSDFEYSNEFFLILNSIILTIFIYLSLKAVRKLEQISLALIISGAVGNLIDRIVHSGVIDFIYFHYESFSFPVFNLADSFISIGAFLLLINEIKIKRSVKKNEN